MTKLYCIILLTNAVITAEGRMHRSGTSWATTRSWAVVPRRRPAGRRSPRMTSLPGRPTPASRSLRSRHFRRSWTGRAAEATTKSHNTGRRPSADDRPLTTTMTQWDHPERSWCPPGSPAAASSTPRQVSGPRCRRTAGRRTSCRWRHRRHFRWRRAGDSSRPWRRKSSAENRRRRRPGGGTGLPGGGRCTPRPPAACRPCSASGSGAPGARDRAVGRNRRSPAVPGSARARCVSLRSRPGDRSWPAVG